MPHVEWRGGTCRVKWWTGETLPNGRKRYESKGGFTDEDLALQHGMDMEYEVRHGVNITNRDGAMPMPEWLDAWYASLDLAHRSMVNYESVIRVHIKPYFSRHTVSEVSIMDHRAFKRHLADVLPSDNSRQSVLAVFSMAMEDAVNAGLRKTSPVERHRRRGKYKKKKRERKKDMPPGAVETLARNAHAVFGPAGYAFMWTMACTGMRPAELYGLTREYCYPSWPGSDLRADPDEADRYAEDMLRYGKGDGLLPAIRVERQVQYKDGGLQFFPPKYESSRTLVVPPFLAEMLERLLKEHESRWVFPSISGGNLRSANFDHKYWRPIADGAKEDEGPRRPGERLALPEVPAFAGKRLYLIRHGAKAWLDEDGHSRFAVESRMGHEVPGVEGVYSSMTVPMERAIMKSQQERWESLPDRLGDAIWG
ncbi:integrase [Streptomyces sp. NPDC057552]|uniref:integrase n=1 Tax=Streptomyces sp. NPDC057552 TaxID=3350537 RepID=UPI00367DEC10